MGPKEREAEVMEDKGICPYCRQEFEVKEYGFRLDCPSCGDKIDVFPDSTWIETEWGTFGISGNSFLGLLSGLFKKAH
jgi:DNA-directed RNA polymerase subunit RPC12/RpoP